MSEQNRDVPGYYESRSCKAKLGCPRLSQVILPICAGISHHIPSCTELSSEGISQDIPGYPKTRFLSWDIPLQVFCFGLSRVIPGYTPSRDIPGYPGITLHVVFPDEGQKAEAEFLFCQRSFDRAVMVAEWYDLQLTTLATRVRTLPWARRVS